MTALFKHRAIAAGFRILSAAQAERWLAPLARGRGLILTFHRVRPASRDPFQPNALLEITPEHLDRTLTLVRDQGFDIVPLDEVPGRLRSGGPRFAALTFDDGYRDNRDYALPILRRHRAPWTMFVTTDFPSGLGRLWWIELEELIRRRNLLTIRIDGEWRDLPTGTAHLKAEAYALAYRELRSRPERELRFTLERWGDDIGLDRGDVVRSACLNWGELAELGREPNLCIGAHTMTHPMLAQLPEQAARREIVDSRAIISERLGREIRHFAYPVGDPGSAGPREFRLAGEAGYATAVTTRPGHLFAGHAQHLTALPRISVNGLHQSDAAIRSLLSGVPTLLWNRGRRIDVGPP